MAITRFDRQAYPKYTSQFVEEKYPYEAIQQAGQQMQGQISGVRQAAGALSEQLSIPVEPDLPAQDLHIAARKKEQEYQQRVNDAIKDFQKTDNINKTVRELQNLSTQWQNDPLRKNVEFLNEQWKESKKQEQKLASQRKPYINLYRQRDIYDPKTGGVVNLQGPSVVQGITEGTIRKEIIEPLTDEVGIQSFEDEKGVVTKKRGLKKIRNLLGVSDKGDEVTDSNKGFSQLTSSYDMEQLKELTRRSGLPFTQEGLEQLYLDQANQRAEELYRFSVGRQAPAGGKGDEEKIQPAELSGISQYNLSISQTQPELGKEGRQTITQGLINEGVLHEGKTYDQAINVLEGWREALSRGEKPKGEFIDEIKNTFRGDSDLVANTIFGSDKRTIRNVTTEDLNKVEQKLQGKEQEILQPQQEPIQLSGKYNYQRLTGDQQDKIENYKFDEIDSILDAERGAVISGQIFNEGNIEAGELVSLPLQKKGNQYQEVSGPNKTFVRASGWINPKKLDEDLKERLVESLNLSSTDDLPSDERIRFNNLLIPVNDKITKSIFAATKSRSLKDAIDKFIKSGIPSTEETPERL